MATHFYDKVSTICTIFIIFKLTTWANKPI